MDVEEELLDFGVLGGVVGGVDVEEREDDGLLVVLDLDVEAEGSLDIEVLVLAVGLLLENESGESTLTENCGRVLR